MFIIYTEYPYRTRIRTAFTAVPGCHFQQLGVGVSGGAGQPAASWDDLGGYWVPFGDETQHGDETPTFS